MIQESLIKRILETNIEEDEMIELLKKDPFILYKDKRIDDVTLFYVIDFLEENCWTKTHFFKKELMIKKSLNPNWLDFLVGIKEFKNQDDLYYKKGDIPVNIAYIQELIPSCIISHLSALIEHNLSDDFHNMAYITVLEDFEIPKNVLKKFPNLIVSRKKEELFELGLVEKKLVSHELIRIYDREMTICDAIANEKKFDVETFVKAMDWYFSDSSKNINLLFGYAKKLGIEEKVKEYSKIQWEKMLQE